MSHGLRHRAMNNRRQEMHQIQDEDVSVSSPRTELGKSVNTDEAAALGGVYQAAHLSKGFRVKKFGIRDATIYPIQVGGLSPWVLLVLLLLLLLWLHDWLLWWWMLADTLRFVAMTPSKRTPACCCSTFWLLLKQKGCLWQKSVEVETINETKWRMGKSQSRSWLTYHPTDLPSDCNTISLLPLDCPTIWLLPCDSYHLTPLPSDWPTIWLPCHLTILPCNCTPIFSRSWKVQAKCQTTQVKSVSRRITRNDVSWCTMHLFQTKLLC